MTICNARRVQPLVLASLACLLIACGDDSAVTATQPTYAYQAPPATGDGWQVADARAQDVDTALLEDLINRLRRQDLGFRYIDAVLIAKDGHLILSEQIRQQLDFTDDMTANREVELHALYSVTKSFTSTLIGIAIDRGAIPGVQVSVHDYFTDKLPIANWSDAKAAITLQDWLTMRPGYGWDESGSYWDPSNINFQMSESSDPMQFLLDLPLANAPGEVFAYSTGVSFGLGQLIESATGQSVTSFMEAYLFAPLNIDNYTYWSIGGEMQAGAGLFLNIRDMAKLGQLFLDAGVWNGVRVVSESWVNEATTARVDVDSRRYGYQWWLRSYQVGAQEYETFYANGLGGQAVWVFPALNTVVAMSGSAYEQDEINQRDVPRVMEEFILPAVL
jgi:CubicO group peptidase (beta-lactamase class C family)